MGSPVYINLGDSAILIAQIEFLKKMGIPSKAIKEVTCAEYYKDRELLKKAIKPTDLICGLGGGNMGNQWYWEEKFRYDLLDDFPENPIIIFPQTLYYTQDEKGEQDKEKSIPYYNERNKLTLVAREEKSYLHMKDLYPNADILLTPDIVLSTTLEDFQTVCTERRNVLLCIRNDAEKTIKDSVWQELEDRLKQMSENTVRMDMYSDRDVTKENRRSLVRDKMSEFGSAKLVITDRLHGMIFAVITETPCIVFSNYNHKVSGTYEWIKELPYIRFAESVEEAQKAIDELIVADKVVYDNSTWIENFGPLQERIKKYAFD